MSDFDVMKESFIKMGYGENMATLMARGRNTLEEVGENTRYTQVEPSGPAPAVKVAGSFQAKDDPKTNRNFDGMLEYLLFSHTTFDALVADYKQNLNRDLAVKLLATHMDAMGFTPESAAKAAQAICGPDEFPAQKARDEAGDQTVGKNKESKDPSADLVQAFGELGLNENESRRWINRHNVLGREDEPEPLKEAGTQPLAHHSQDITLKEAMRLRSKL